MSQRGHFWPARRKGLHDICGTSHGCNHPLPCSELWVVLTQVLLWLLFGEFQAYCPWGSKQISVSIVQDWISQQGECSHTKQVKKTSSHYTHFCAASILLGKWAPSPGVSSQAPQSVESFRNEWKQRPYKFVLGAQASEITSSYLIQFSSGTSRKCSSAFRSQLTLPTHLLQGPDNSIQEAIRSLSGSVGTWGAGWRLPGAQGLLGRSAQTSFHI